jgi:hypothetical protein
MKMPLSSGHFLSFSSARPHQKLICFRLHTLSEADFSDATSASID